MNNLQITINACLAITVAVLIYQNQQIKNQLDTFKRDIEVINSPYREAIPLSMITGAYFECQAVNGKKLTFLTYPEADISIYRSTGRIEFVHHRLYYYIFDDDELDDSISKIMLDITGNGKYDYGWEIKI